MLLIKQKIIVNLHKHSQKALFNLLFCTLLASLSFFAVAKTTSASTQSLQNIRIAAKIFLEEKHIAADNLRTEITIGQIDARLRLVECLHQPQFFLPQNIRRYGKITLGVKCTSPVSWKFFIPVQIEKYQQGWVLNRTVAAGDIISLSDLSEQSIAVTNSRKQPMTNVKKLLNTSPKRIMRAGATLYQGSVCLVCRGDQVSISVNNSFMNISALGRAMSDAVLGEKIQVKNIQSNKIFGAIVTGKNQLSVSLAGSQ